MPLKRIANSVWHLSPLSVNNVIKTGMSAKLSLVVIYLPSLYLRKSVDFEILSSICFPEIAKFIRQLSPLNENDVKKTNMYINLPPHIIYPVVIMFSIK